MFSNNFVVAIQLDGKTLEENRAGQVKVPFDSEYTIFLKNKHDIKATANVKIDGEDIGTFIVDANSSLDLKRSADKNKAFRFVKADSKEANAAGKGPKSDGSTGLVEVEWHLEKQYKYNPVPYIPKIRKDPKPVDPYIPLPSPWQPDPWVTRPPRHWDIYCGGDPNIQVSYNTTTYVSNGFSSSVKSLSCQQGVTVDGEKTDQEFVNSYLTTESVSTIIRLVLVGYEIDAEKASALKQIKELKNQLAELEKKIKA